MALGFFTEIYSSCVCFSALDYFCLRCFTEHYISLILYSIICIVYLTSRLFFSDYTLYWIHFCLPLCYPMTSASSVDATNAVLSSLLMLFYRQKFWASKLFTHCHPQRLVCFIDGVLSTRAVDLTPLTPTCAVVLALMTTDRPLAERCFHHFYRPAKMCPVPWRQRLLYGGRPYLTATDLITWRLRQTS